MAALVGHHGRKLPIVSVEEMQRHTNGWRLSRILPTVALLVSIHA
ncbi:MAG: hypothetical protein R2710_30520 [Acidimicrobiales bacterium]